MDPDSKNRYVSIILKAGAKIAMGMDLSAYQHSLDPIPKDIRQSLVNDLV